MKKLLVFGVALVALGSLAVGDETATEQENQKTPVLMVNGVNILANVPEEPELSPADAAEKEDHDRRVKLSRLMFKISIKEQYLARVDAAVDQATKELEWVRNNLRYVDTEKVKHKCAACGGDGKISTTDNEGNAKSVECPRCGGDGVYYTEKKVTKVRDVASYEKKLTEAQALQKKTSAELDAMRKEAATLRGDEPKKTVDATPVSPAPSNDGQTTDK